ncbi:hypothetical protein [Candidatus Agathobaculum pullicola]|uniref:hypothetical protein n=1 Tax=Candidatus Agathobaculum pullicola TaxID=2838426 RepID=UPI003F91532B
MEYTYIPVMPYGAPPFVAKIPAVHSPDELREKAMEVYDAANAAVRYLRNMR